MSRVSYMGHLALYHIIGVLLDIIYIDLATPRCDQATPRGCGGA